MQNLVSSNTGCRATQINNCHDNLRVCCTLFIHIHIHLDKAVFVKEKRTADTPTEPCQGFPVIVNQTQNVTTMFSTQV